MALVALQLGMLFGSVVVAKRSPLLLEKTTSWQCFFASFLLMLAGIWGLTTQRCEVVSWCCFTTGALLIGLQMGRYPNESLKRGLVQASVLLILAAAMAPFAGYYSGAAGMLTLLTFGLLAALIGCIIWPSSAAEAIISAGGSALFAVWTIHDVAKRPCESPWLKSVEVFLDIFNLLAFSVR